MKTFIECIKEAAGREYFWEAAELIDSLDDCDMKILQNAADMYTKLSNSHKHGVSGSVCQCEKPDPYTKMPDKCFRCHGRILQQTDR